MQRFLAVLAVFAILAVPSVRADAPDPPDKLAADIGNGSTTFTQAGFSGGWYYRNGTQMFCVGRDGPSEWIMHVYQGSPLRYRASYRAASWDLVLPYVFGPGTFSRTNGVGPAKVVLLP